MADNIFRQISSLAPGVETLAKVASRLGLESEMEVTRGAQGRGADRPPSNVILDIYANGELATTYRFYANNYIINGDNIYSGHYYRWKDVKRRIVAELYELYRETTN